MQSPPLQIAAPSPDLQPYVRFYYEADLPNPGPEQTIPAWTRSSLVFHFCDSLRSDINGREERVRPFSATGVIDQSYRTWSTAPAVRMLVANLTPTGLPGLFRESSAVFRNASADLSDLLPLAKRRSIAEQLQEARGFGARVALLESFLRRIAPPHEPERLRALRHVTQLLSDPAWRGRIAEAAREVNMSERNLRRVFPQTIGVRMQTLLRIERFTRWFNLWMAAEGRSWKDLAVAEDYYDQSHFIKEFRAFTGYSPERLPAENFQLFHRITR